MVQNRGHSGWKLKIGTESPVFTSFGPSVCLSVRSPGALGRSVRPLASSLDPARRARVVGVVPDEESGESGKRTKTHVQDIDMSTNSPDCTSAPVLFGVTNVEAPAHYPGISRQDTHWKRQVYMYIWC